MTLLIISESLGLFANALTVNDNLLQPIEMQLSKKQKVFCKFFAAFVIATSNFENFEKKHELDSLCISENLDCHRRCYLTL